MAVKEATGSKVTVGRKTYELLGYDENGSRVYQDAEVLKQQTESKQTEDTKNTDLEDGQKTIEKPEDGDIITTTKGIGLQFFAKKSQDYPTVKLERGEYAHVMSEIATNLTKEQAKKEVFKKVIGEFVYTVENNGFGDYRIIKKTKIQED